MVVVESLRLAMDAIFTLSTPTLSSLHGVSGITTSVAVYASISFGTQKYLMYIKHISLLPGPKAVQIAELLGKLLCI